MAAKPEFIFVPGAWHSPESFEPTTALLAQAGYAVHGVTLPSFGAQPPLQSFEPDVQAVQDIVGEVLSSGRDAVLVMHSYGGVVGCESLREYVSEAESGKGDRRQQQQQGRRGRLRRLVFVSAFVMPEGGSLMAGFGGQNLPWMEVDGDAARPTDPKELFYNDLSPEAAAPHIAAIRHHSFRTFSSRLTVAPWKTIPSTYVVCEKDNAIPVQGQDQSSKM
ncbi:hypothetical protein LZ554_003778 [Drepanopeziza brunnea f. sp. 'monogermtubi']|nr:hypothetical protein LZ554_003778 [Drepanopeziza brunnea f. sp. 'monogermtubi']